MNNRMSTARKLQRRKCLIPSKSYNKRKPKGRKDLHWVNWERIQRYSNPFLLFKDIRGALDVKIYIGVKKRESNHFELPYPLTHSLI